MSLSGLCTRTGRLICSIQPRTRSIGRFATVHLPHPRSTHHRPLSSAATSSSTVSLEGYSLDHPECNVPVNIVSRVGRNLHLQTSHPLNILKSKLEQYFGTEFMAVDDLSPIVSVEDNFDKLLIPDDHVSRSYSDTYYLNKNTVLRCHTSAHQSTLLNAGHSSFLVTGDVYRRDEIDNSHYPVFHQMEGVKVFENSELGENSSQDKRMKLVEEDLKQQLEGMTRSIFGNVEMRWVDAYFPFTDPSFELEIYYQDEWLEVLGCGVMQPQILLDAGRRDSTAWAFGLGLERLAMVLFSIPDIRLFWSQDKRFHSQFQSGDIVKFQPYSKYPPCFKDISFWIHEEFHPNDLMEVVRNVAGDLVEQVELVDEFMHPKTQRTSNCFRIAYRSMDRSLTHEEIDELQEQVRDLTRDSLKLELR